MTRSEGPLDPDVRVVLPVSGNGFGDWPKELTINVVKAQGELAVVRFMGEFEPLDSNSLRKKLVAELAAYPREMFPDRWVQFEGSDEWWTEISVHVRISPGAHPRFERWIREVCHEVRYYKVRITRL